MSTNVLSSPVSPKKGVGTIDWVNSTFLTLTPLIALTVTPFYLFKWDLHWSLWALFGFYLVATGISITGGYHRYYAHRSYKARRRIQLFYLIFGAAACQNSAIKWASDHRRHHRFVDTDGDPYNIKKGFFWAHIGWVMMKKGHDFSNARDLERDPLVMWQNRWYLPLAITAGFVVPFALGLVWGTPWGAVLVCGVARIVIVHHSTFLINSLCHYMGGQNYSTRDSSRDSALIALLTYGEGYHNFHHSFPIDYRNGIRWFHWDPTKWWIKGLSLLGWTWGLRRVNDLLIFQSRLAMQHQRVLARLSDQSHDFRSTMETKLQAAYDGVVHAGQRLRQLRTEYDAVRSSMDSKREELTARLRHDLAAAKRQFRQSQSAWRGILAACYSPIQRVPANLA